MPKGWFKYGGHAGDRTLDEQMAGLEPALADCAGRSVYDFGCAEGLIGIEFGKRGAARVRGCDILPRYVARANYEADQVGLGITCQFTEYDLRQLCADDAPDFLCEGERFEIVLALAIVHKLHNPERALRTMAEFATRRLVLRLPFGSEGVIHYKHGRSQQCDSRLVMPDCGFTLEQVLPGPRGEWVQHWRRR